MSFVVVPPSLTLIAVIVGAASIVAGVLNVLESAHKTD
jgi:hypothetical protein